MQTINGIVYRNLQEQVDQNKNDIAAWKDAAKFDIRTVGTCATADDLPSPTTYTGDYGDMYAVGTEAPYEYYIFTRPTSSMTYPYWFDAGQLQIQGDQGPQGIQGEAGPTGERGSLWTSNTSNPGATGNTKAGDQHLRTDNGDVFQFDGSAWNRTGNIRGPQGIQGAQGLQGPKGDTGETGPKGDTGDVGGFINIVATLATADLLPDPATLDNLTYAYLVGDNNELYIQVGKTSDVAVWKNMGSFNMTANHWTLNDSNQLVPSNNDDVTLNNLTVLGSTSLKSPSISGVTSCSAIASPSTLTLSGTTDTEVLVNGTTIAKYQSDGMYLPTLNAPTDNVDYTVTMADSSGKLLKANNLSYNPYETKLHVKNLAADKVYLGGTADLSSLLDSKIDKNTTSQYIVYGTTTAGTQGNIPYTSLITPNAILSRNSSGQAQIKSYNAGPTVYTDTTTDNYIVNIGQLTKMHKYDYGIECWSNTLIIGDIESPKTISLVFLINGNGDQCPIWMFQLNNSTDTTTLNWSDLDQTVLLPFSNTIYWLGDIEPIFEYGKRYTLMFWPADSTKIGQSAGTEYTGALIGTWSAA